MKKLFQFNWILKVRTSDPLIFLVLFQPFCFIWMYKIGRFGEKRLGLKSNKLFVISIWFLFVSLLFIVLYSQSNFNSAFELKVKDLIDLNEDLIIGAFIGLMIFAWTYCSYYSMKITLKLDELKDRDHYPTFSDKVYRFFQFYYWIFGIWILQPRINKYYDDEAE